MTDTLTEIHARLRAADCALARSRGGSSELAQLREAVGSLLLAVHALAGLWEGRASAPAAEASRPTRRRQQP